jgi:hypothetical protein
MRVRWRWLAAAVLVAGAPILAPTGAAGAHAPRAASGPGASAGAIVTCDVLALGSDELPVANLTQADFEVQIDGAPAPIARFSPAPSSLSVVVLVDGTASQPLKRYEYVTGVQTGLIPNLMAGDRARLAVLGNPTVIGPWLPADRVAALNSVRVFLDRTPLEPSPIWDAIDLAAQALAAESAPRVLILLTDGRSAGNALSLDDAAKRALAAGVSISVVSEGGEWLIPQFGDAPDRARSDVSLRWLADTTGGLFLPDGTARRTLKPQMNAFAYVKELVNTPSRPAPLFASILSAMRSRYRLGFEATADGRVHTLDVRAKRPGIDVRAPRTFLAK